MAEFCLACWNRMSGKDEPARYYVLSRRRELCEGCDRAQRVILYRRDDAPPRRRGREYRGNLS